LVCSLQLADSDAYGSAYGFSVAEAKVEAISARSNAQLNLHDTAFLPRKIEPMCNNEANDERTNMTRRLSSSGCSVESSIKPCHAQRRRSRKIRVSMHVIATPSYAYPRRNVTQPSPASPKPCFPSMPNLTVHTVGSW
jgi:hypothetical protein